MGRQIHLFAAAAAAGLALIGLAGQSMAASPQPFTQGYPQPGPPGTPTSWFPGGTPHKAAAARTASPASHAWFPWYDNTSPGFTVDNIHLVNPNPAAVSGTISLPGQNTIAFTLNPGDQHYFSFPPGARGGPVVVDAGAGTVVATQRTTFLNSFNELPALTLADAASTRYFAWFDNSSAGMISDNVHVVNVGSTPATVSIKVANLAPVSKAIQPGAADYLSYPAPGALGGPVVVDAGSGGQVIATQRVAFGQSFSEIPASAASPAPATLYLNWYDDNGSWGFLNDNVHVVNAGTSPADITVTVAGQSHVLTGVAAGAAAFTTFAAVTGGPVVITSAQPLVASQRFLYYSDLVEQPAVAATAAVAAAWLPWYDNASQGITDDIHLTNPDPSNTATVNVFFPGRNPVTVTVGPRTDAYYGYPRGTIGGPVQVAVASGSPSVIVGVRSFLYIPPPPPPPPPPARHIIVSLSQQHLWAWDGDHLFLETDITTGRPELPTPPGHYSIFDKRSPFEFISPWPYGSPYWYPSAWVSWAMEFIQGGYYLHDAPWRSWYGPGSNYGDGTHGCVNVPHDPMSQLWGWAQIGDVVDVVN